MAKFWAKVKGRHGSSVWTIIVYQKAWLRPVVVDHVICSGLTEENVKKLAAKYLEKHINDPVLNKSVEFIIQPPED